MRRSATLAALLVLACSVSLRSEPAVAEDRFAFRVLASGLESPWEITWGPDGHLWVTEREGKRITRIDPANGSKTVAVAIPDAFQDSDHQGVLGMALHPNLLRQTGEDYVYVAYVYVASRAPVTLRARIARYLQTLRSAGLNDTRVLAEYGLAYLKELHEGPDRRYSGW